MAAILGLLLGLNAGGQALPVEFKWGFGLAFALFFGVLAFVFTGMGVRRESGGVSETFLAVPPVAPATLRTAIETANPPQLLTPAEIGLLDATLAELEDMTRLLKKNPRSGTQPEIKDRLEQIAARWLSQAEVDAWLEYLDSDQEI